MDLIQYLSQGKDKKGKLIKRKGKKKLDRIPRRGRGFGQRHRAYREKKEKDSSIDKQLLALLTTIVKQNQPKIDLSNPQALNPFIEKDRQTYSMKFDSNKKPDKEDLYTMDEKKGIRKQITMGEGEDIEGEEGGVDIQNKLEDYKTKWSDIVELQQELNQEINDIPIGSMREVAQENLRMQNLEVKESVFSLQQELQEDLNQATDLNKYKDFVNLQKTVLEDSIDNFVAVDNRISKELKQSKQSLTEETEGFKALQEDTFNEKLQLQQGYDLLDIELVKSQDKEMQLKDELNTVTGQYTKLQEKVFQMETNPTSPPRVEIEPEIEIPKPKPTEEELQAKKEKKEALRIGREELEKKKQFQENENTKLTTQLTDWSTNASKNYSKSIQQKVEKLFGEEENEKIKRLGPSLAPKVKRIKQLLKEKRGVEF
tara:strand:+ start:2061 stop:3344 length:1284 start_codon:yes stop_codon:yes gene_type:complete